MKEKQNKEDIIAGIKEKLNENEKDIVNVLKLAVQEENRENVCHKLDGYYDYFLELEEYSNCKKKLSEITDKIDNIEDKGIREIFADYQHYLQKSNEYELCLANALGLKDGLIISLLK